MECDKEQVIGGPGPEAQLRSEWRPSTKLIDFDAF